MHIPFPLMPILVGLLSIASPPAATPPDDETLAAEIDQLAARALAAPGAAGLSIAVARGDRVVLSKGYGFADLEHGTPATDSTLFRIASVTKQYTAAAVIKLVEEGRLSLDDDITRFVAFPTQGRTVTVRHLLTHTSGIKNYTDLTAQQEPSAGDIAPEEVLDLVRELPLDFEPGAAWAYSNTGYHLLGLIVEEVSGVTYAQYLQDVFFTPLGLDRTRYDVASEVIPGRARGYQLLNGKAANAGYINMQVPYASGSLLASAGDLVAWQLALIAGRVVSPESYERMTTPATLADGSSVDYGFGMRISDLDGHRSIMHAGGINGFNSVLAFYPEEGLSVAVISNSEAVPSTLLGQDIARAALGIAADLEDLTLSAEELGPLTGAYRIDEIELDFVVTASKGKLFVQGTGEAPVPVLAQSGGEFRASWDPSLKIIFDPPASPGEKCPSFTLEQGGQRFTALRVP